MNGRGRVRLYIDVDGVVLKPTDPGGPAMQTTAVDLEPFFEWAVVRFDCYWLTAWGIDGDGRKIRRDLLPHLPPSARKVKLARWKRLKTDAFAGGRFLWIDDELYTGERDFLRRRGWLSRYLRVDPKQRSLAPVMRRLEARARRLFSG